MRRKIKTIEDVAARQLCCGCGACASVCSEAVEMIDTLDYGRRPRFREGARGVAAHEAMAVCPGVSLQRLTKPEDQIEDRRFFDTWGPVLGVWEGYAVDPQIRFEGSSGGVATALALWAMDKNNMEGTLHIAPRQDVPLLNQTVLSRNREQLMTGAGSRYAPASPCDGLRQIEDNEGSFVFIGKPCDVAAIGKVVAMQPQFGEKIGLTIAFFCAGTPSTRGTLDMLRQMGIDDPVSVVSLRYRGHGWPGKATVGYRDGNGTLQYRQLTYEESWGDILQKHRQWRCYVCPDHIGEYADIAVGDAWHLPVKDHQPGRSVIIARTRRGLDIIHRSQREGYLFLEVAAPDVLNLCMPWQRSLKGQLWARIQTLRAMGVPTPDYQGFDLFRLWRTELSIKEKKKSILSTVKRVFVKKLYRPRNMVSYSSCFFPWNEQL